MQISISMQKLGNIRNSSYVLLIYQAFGTEFANYCKFAAYATQVDQEIYETFLRYISIFYLANDLLSDWPSDLIDHKNIQPTDDVLTLDAEGFSLRKRSLTPRWSKDSKLNSPRLLI